MSLPVIRIVDDDRDLLESLRAYLATLGWQVRAYESAEAFLASRPRAVSSSTKPCRG